MTRAYLTAAAPRPANGYVPFHDPQGQIVYHHGYFRPDITYVQPADSARLTDRRWITLRTAPRWEYRGAGERRSLGVCVWRASCNEIGNRSAVALAKRYRRVP
jgi:hypothetical protein